MKKEKKGSFHECDCNHPEIHDSFKDGKCSDEQIIICHGHDLLDKLKKEGM